MIASTWNIEPVKILTRRELTCVLEDLARRAARSASTRMNRTIFRLACCCGLRVSEIAALQLMDVCVGIDLAASARRSRRCQRKQAPHRAPVVGRRNARGRDGLEAGTGEPGRLAGGSPDLLSLANPARSRLKAFHRPRAFPDRLQVPRLGASSDLDDPPRTAHLHQSCPCRRPNPCRSTLGRGSHQPGHDQRLPAHRGGR